MEELRLQSLCRGVILAHLKRTNPHKQRIEAVEQLNLTDSLKHYLLLGHEDWTWRRRAKTDMWTRLEDLKDDPVRNHRIFMEIAKELEDRDEVVQLGLLLDAHVDVLRHLVREKPADTTYKILSDFFESCPLPPKSKWHEVKEALVSIGKQAAIRDLGIDKLSDDARGEREPSWEGIAVQSASPTTDREEVFRYNDQDKKILESLKDISYGARKWEPVEMLAAFLAQDRGGPIQCYALRSEGHSVQDAAFEVMSSFYNRRTDLSRTKKLSSLKLAMCRAGWDSRHMKKLDAEVEDDVDMEDWRHHRLVGRDTDAWMRWNPGDHRYQLALWHSGIHRETADTKMVLGNTTYNDQEMGDVKRLKHISSGATECIQVETLAFFLSRFRVNSYNVGMRIEGLRTKDAAFVVLSDFYSMATNFSRAEKLHRIELAMQSAGLDLKMIRKLCTSESVPVASQAGGERTSRDTGDCDQKVDHEALRKVADVFSAWEEVYALGELLKVDKDYINRLRAEHFEITTVTYGILSLFYAKNFALTPEAKWEKVKDALASLEKSSVIKDLEAGVRKRPNKTEEREVNIPEDATSTKDTDTEAALETAMKRTSITDSETGAAPPVLKKPRTSNQDMSAKDEVIDSSGGEIYIEGVRLTIPRGALNRTEQITLSVLRSLEHVSDLEPEEALLSPVVSCEPQGLQFEKPVTLSIPHFAYNIKEDWPEVFVMKSETDPYTAPDWKTVLPEAKDVETSRTTESHIVLEIMHFTLYRFIGRLTGRRKAKLVQLTATAAQRVKMDEFLDVTVRATNDYSHCEEREDKVRDKQPIQFYNDGGNLCVELNDPPKGWKPRSSLQQEMDAEMIWKAASPRCKFVLDSTTRSEDKVYYEIKNFQKKYKDLSQTLQITQYRETCSVATFCQPSQAHAMDHPGYQVKKPASQTGTQHVMSTNGRSKPGAGASACEQSAFHASGATGFSLVPPIPNAKSSAAPATHEPPLVSSTGQQNNREVNGPSGAQHAAPEQRSYSSGFWPQVNLVHVAHTPEQNGTAVPNPMLPSGDAQPQIPETPCKLQVPWDDKLLLKVADLITEDVQVTELGAYLDVDRHCVQQIICDQQQIKMRAWHVLLKFDEGDGTYHEPAKRCKLRRALYHLRKANFIHSLRL